MTMLGKKHTVETRQRMSLSAKLAGTGRWLKGRKHTEQEKTNLSEKRHCKDNPNWKGVDVKYLGLHAWIYRNFGLPDKCENVDCIYPRKSKMGYMMFAPKRYEWANLTGVYNRERRNWIKLCPSCHRLYDRNQDFILTFAI